MGKPASSLAAIAGGRIEFYPFTFDPRLENPVTTILLDEQQAKGMRNCKYCHQLQLFLQVQSRIRYRRLIIEVYLLAIISCPHQTRTHR
eukprot:g41194.t1